MDFNVDKCNTVSRITRQYYSVPASFRSILVWDVEYHDVVFGWYSVTKINFHDLMEIVLDQGTYIKSTKMHGNPRKVK